MEKIVRGISHRVASELNADDERRQVIEYGLFAILQIIVFILLIVGFGFLFGVVTEGLVICFTGSLLRKYSGGAHASTPGNCTIIGTVVCLGFAIILKKILITTYSLKYILCIEGLLFCLGFYLLYKLAPVDSPSKPIKNKKKICKMKKRSILMLSLYFIVNSVLLVLYLKIKDKGLLVYSLCLISGISWQIFTLTKLGHYIMGEIDSFLYKTFLIVKGGNS